jgi:hypothetical protein
MRFIEIKHPMGININNQEDEYLQLQYVIEAKRNMLLKKQKRLQKIAQQNQFLEHVKNDYLQYNNYIVKQKQDQITALQLLNNYIDDLNKSGQLSQQNLRDARIEQKKIVKELKFIKRGLDKIMNDSDEINNSLIGREKQNVPNIQNNQNLINK